MKGIVRPTGTTLRLFAITPAIGISAHPKRALATTNLRAADSSEHFSRVRPSMSSSSTSSFSADQSTSRSSAGSKTTTSSSPAVSFDEILASIFRSVEGNGSPLRPPPLPLGAKKPQIWGASIKAEDAQRRLQAKLSEAEQVDQAVLKELNLLKAELAALQSDTAILSWAKSSLFRTTLDESGELSYSRAYPEILAHTMQVLRQNYDNPHLALALFHHAKTLGPESYVAGCLVKAYNEVLTIRWDALRDFAGFELTIQEMDANAVLWNQQTTQIVGKVVDVVGRDLNLGREAKWGSKAYDKLAGLEKMLQHSFERHEQAAKRARTGLSGFEVADDSLSTV